MTPFLIYSNVLKDTNGVRLASLITFMCRVSFFSNIALFINDLTEYIKLKSGNGVFMTKNIDDLSAIMFADDISSLAETAVKLKTQINLISNFCIETSMKLNLDR